MDVGTNNNLNQLVQLKPHSNICPNIALGIFKRFLTRALHICSENYLSQEIKFLINVFAENGHSKQVLEKVTKKYISTTLIPKKERVNIETIKNGKIVKLPWVPKLGPKVRK